GSTPENGPTLHLVGVGNNRIGKQRSPFRVYFFLTQDCFFGAVYNSVFESLSYTVVPVPGYVKNGPLSVPFALGQSEK
ncbi:MAG: hypothetical protein O2967_21620, partial [Proteobacteria bacterium]|nr:hypothetical protein [Pseudomonadota bacterium]